MRLDSKIGMRLGSVGLCPRNPRTCLALRVCMNLNYLLAVLCFVFWIVVLVDCIRSNNPNKVLWIILIILLPFLGSVLYFILGKSSRI